MGARDAATLQQEWQAKRGGAVLYQARNWRGLSIQFLPGLTTPRALLDVRVREALAHGIDRATLSDAIYAGTASEADYFLPPDGAWGPEVQRGAIKYGYDLQRSEQLMREAGFEKGSDGAYASPQEGQFAMEARVTAASASELAALADGLGRAGFKIDQRVIPQALALDLETKAGYPGMFLTTQVATERTATAPIPGNIPTPENGWRGGSQISWTHPEYTRLVQQFTSTLERAQRGEQMMQMARIFSEDLAVISLYFPRGAQAAAAGLTGPRESSADTVVFWNIHEWEIR
jgi:ABC-type transport system substrate-binding protein